VEQAVATRRFPALVPPSLSADGRSLAFTLQDPRRVQPTGDRLFTATGVSLQLTGCDVWITHCESGKAVNLTESKGSSWSPVWSADGALLAFYSDRDGKAGLWVWERASGTLRRLSKEVVHPVCPFEAAHWMPDGHSVLTKILPAGQTLESASRLLATDQTEYRDARQDGSPITVLRSPEGSEAQSSSPSLNEFRGDLVLVDARNGTVRRLVHNVPTAWYQPSPDGTRVAFVEFTQYSETELKVLALADGKIRRCATGLRLGPFPVSVSWSPNGEKIAYLNDGPGGDGECYLVSIAGGEPTKAVSATHPRFRSNMFQCPIWDETGKILYLLTVEGIWRAEPSTGAANELARIPGRAALEILAVGDGGVVWSPDGRQSLIVVTREEATRRSGFFRVNRMTGEKTRLLEEEKAYSRGLRYGFAMARQSNDLAYAAQSARESEEFWLIRDGDFQRPRRITRCNRAQQNCRLGESIVVDWRASDGKKLRGAVLLPAGYVSGRRYPLITYVYGGLRIGDLPYRYGVSDAGGLTNLQLFASRGYAVLVPEAPYRPGSVRRDLAAAVSGGVDRVVAIGIADPARLGVWGHSFGGYTTLAVLTEDARFRAAAVSAGWADLLGLLDSSAIRNSPNGRSTLPAGLRGTSAIATSTTLPHFSE
jgi:dipeptidyl aminopeptidase/acylaminoacyl peptidase